MKFEEALLLAEERNGNDFLNFKVELGENEGENIPHFHLDNGEIGKKKKKTAIMLNMPFYFLHGDKTYKFNSKEKKLFCLWLKQRPSLIAKGNIKPDGTLPINNWENLACMWNRYYPQAAIKMTIPDYSTLSKDYKEA